MKFRILISLIPLLISVSLLRDGIPVSAKTESRRIAFEVRSIAEMDGRRSILSHTTIDGLPGTDFKINLQTAGYKMESRFITDPVGTRNVRIRARLNTRRFFGYSPKKLPLYEEDNQAKSMDVGFGQRVVLLPFGRNGENETLKIEITPRFSNARQTGPIDIKFNKPLPGGEIYIEASKLPHNYLVEAALLADGKVIAAGSAECLYEEEKEIRLTGTGEGSGANFLTKVTVNKYSRNRPEDLAGIRFSLFRGSTALIENGAGINMIGEDLSYSLERKLFGDGRRYELRYRIHLAEENK